MMDLQHRMILVGGAELTYVEQGEGDPLIFVHGSLSDVRSWGLQMAPFAQHYRTIAYSRRGHWPNTPAGDGGECAAAVHAADLGALIEALELGPPHLVGSSYGALTALTLAADQPALARTLVLGEPPLLPWLMTAPDGPALSAVFEASAWEPARQAFRRGDPEAGVRLFIDGVIGQGAFERLPPPVRAMIMDNAAEMGFELETPPETYFPDLTCEDVGRIAVPVLAADR